MCGGQKISCSKSLLIRPRSLALPFFRSSVLLFVVAQLGFDTSDMSYDEMVALDEDDSTRSLSNHTRDSRTAVSKMVGAEHLAEDDRSCLICLADVVSGKCDTVAP